MLSATIVTVFLTEYKIQFILFGKSFYKICPLFMLTKMSIILLEDFDPSLGETETLKIIHLELNRN